MVVIVFVPIVLSAPTMLVLVPPSVLLVPATFARLMQLAALVICLSAMAAVLLDGLVKVVLSMLDAPLASLDIVRLSPGHWGEAQKC